MTTRPLSIQNNASCRETRVYHAVRKALTHTQKYYPNSSFAGKGFMSCQAD